LYSAIKSVDTEALVAFQHLTSSSLSTDISLVKFSRLVVFMWGC